MRLLRRAWPLFVALGFGACSLGSDDFNQTLGLSAPPPDEFMIVARAPIEVPRDRSQLPTPQPGAPSRVEPDPRRDARVALLGPMAAPVELRGVGPLSPGEAALLDASGAAGADPSIRSTLVAERREPELRYGIERILGRPLTDPETRAATLRGEEEAERLRQEGLIAPAPPPPAE